MVWKRLLGGIPLILILTFSSADERDKFELLYNRYKSLLLHKAYGILHDSGLAEDAVSEAYLRVYRNLHKIDDPESPSAAAFLVTIVKNTALTLLQKERRQPVLEFEEAAPVADDFDLEAEVIGRMNADDISRVVDSLSDDLRDVFVLRYAYDMPHREIGKALGITENNVTVRLHRARRKLAESLKKEGYAYEK